MKRSLPIVGVALAVLSVVSVSVASARLPGAHAFPASALAQRLSQNAIHESQRWRAYDEAPAQAFVRPVRVLNVTGNVTNPQSLVKSSAGGATTLTYAPDGAPPSLVLDYGTDLGGIASFDIVATSGTTISATYSETLRLLGGDDALSVALFQAGNPQRTETFPAQKPGVVRASLIQGAERYERVTLTTPGSVTLRGAGIQFTSLRETPSVMQGHFLSSDCLLNRVWYAGAYTLNLNQMTPGTAVVPGAVNHLHLILDGAKRDRLVWSGDHLISDLTDYYASNPAYSRDSIALFLAHPASTAGQLAPATGSLSRPGPLPGVCSPNPHRDACDTWSATYSMVVMAALYNYYLYTGDLAFVRRHWQAVVRQMQWDAQQVGPDGLFAVNAGDNADWNIEHVSGKLAYVNAVYRQALQSAAKLASALGRGSQARAWSAAAVAVKNAVDRRLWDPKTGVYDASTTERSSVVQDANVTAILAGIPSPARAHRIVKVLSRALRSRFGPLNVSSPVPPSYTQVTLAVHGQLPRAGRFRRWQRSRRSLDHPPRVGVHDLPRPRRRRLGEDPHQRTHCRRRDRRQLSPRLVNWPHLGAVRIRARRHARHARLREVDRRTTACEPRVGARSYSHTPRRDHRAVAARARRPRLQAHGDRSSAYDRRGGGAVAGAAADDRDGRTHRLGRAARPRRCARALRQRGNRVHRHPRPARLRLGMSGGARVSYEGEQGEYMHGTPTRSSGRWITALCG
jgi:hypothetical protein